MVRIVAIIIRVLASTAGSTRLQAAILLAKMDIFDDEVAARARIGERYSSHDQRCVPQRVRSERRG